MMPPSACQPWPTDTPARSAGERNDAVGSYTTPWDTISDYAPKGLRLINGVSCLASWFDCVVPLTVEIGRRDVKLCHLGGGNLNAFVVGVLCATALDGQALLGRGAGDQLDDDLMGQQGLATPVLRDEGEQAMLDAVPFAGARRQMRHGDGQTRLIGQGLQLGLPQAHPRAVAAAAIGGDQNPLSGGVARLSEFPPPAPDAFHREGGRIAGDAEVDPAGIGGDVVDTVGRHLAQFGKHEIMHPDGFGIALGTQFTTAILEISDEFLLLRVDRDGRLSGGLERVDLRIDVLELRVPVRMARALAGLAVRLQAEAQTTQQSSDQFLTGGE